MDTDMEAQFMSAYDACAEALFRHCYFRVYDRDLAKDLVQETFSRAWTYMSNGKEVQNMRALLYRILHNVIVDEMRRKKTLSLEDAMDNGFEPRGESARETEDRVIFGEILKELHLLDEAHRMVIQMRFIDDLSPKEISVALGISENLASVRINRGVKKLKELIAKDGN